MGGYPLPAWQRALLGIAISLPAFFLPEAPMTEASERRTELVAMRTRLSDAFYDNDTRPADLSPLSRRLMEIDREIEALDAAEAEDADDAPTPDEPFDPSSL